MRARLASWVCAAVLLAPGALRAADPGPAAFDFKPPAPGSYHLPVIRDAADGAVLDSQGRALRLHAALAGKVALLSFIYTRCNDASGCPLATAVLHRIHAASRQDPALAAGLQLLSLSFDPAHDTPEVMAHHGGAAHAGAIWLELTTASEAALAPILKGYDQVVATRAAAPDAPREVVGHQLRVYLIDRQRRVRNIYSADFLDPRLLLADVRTLLAEPPAPAP